MNNEQIFQPFFAMMLLTFAVWIYMYLRRTSYLVGGRIDLRKVDNPAKMDVEVPAEVNRPAYAFRNMLELPVLFYALCLYLYLTGHVDEFYMAASWLFVLGRAIHALIYCTYNKVLHRFVVYFVSALVLWAMVGRAMLGAFGITAT